MDDFVRLATEIEPVIRLAVQEAFRLQGHELTGALINSIEGQVSQTVTGAKIEYLMLDYGQPVNRGVPASRIPYSGRTGSGGTSKYIQGLIMFARLRFKVPEAEAKRIAFAIAHKHRQEGMPTGASSRFSRTGKRTEAIEAGLEDADAEVTRMINLAVEEYINQEIVEAFAQVK